MKAEEIDRILLQCREAAERFHNAPPFPSIIAQLEYLGDFASGRSGDGSRLRDIIIGVQTAREIEQLDNLLADELHRVAAWVNDLIDA